MKIYAYILLLSLTLLGCKSIFGPPTLVCNRENYWLMQKPQHRNPCELEYWENEQFKQKEMNPISFDDINEDDNEL